MTNKEMEPVYIFILDMSLILFCFLPIEGIICIVPLYYRMFNFRHNKKKVPVCPFFV